MKTAHFLHMRHELQDELRAAAPDLCSHEEFSRYGFEIPDSWFDLMLVAVKDLSDVDVPLRLVQVKTKFGNLRIYLDGPPSKKAAAIIIRAERYARYLG